MPFNFFKKKPEVKKPETKPTVRHNFEDVGGQAGKKVSWGGMSGAILRSPRITEKASLLTQENQYVFKVASNATKHAVKNAIQETFGVIATKVNMVTIHSKTKRRGKGFGVTQGYKKAIVKVKEGQKLYEKP